MSSKSGDQLNKSFEKKIENLSTELLIKRKKFSMFILGIVIGVAIIAVITAIWTGNSNSMVPIAALIAVSIPLINGLKKIDAELTKRNDGDNTNSSDSLPELD